MSSCTNGGCGIGTYFDIHRDQCLGCPNGKYNDQVDQNMCKGCPAGRLWGLGTTETGQSSVAACYPKVTFKTSQVQCTNLDGGGWYYITNFDVCREAFWSINEALPAGSKLSSAWPTITDVIVEPANDRSVPPFCSFQINPVTEKKLIRNSMPINDVNTGAHTSADYKQLCQSACPPGYYRDPADSKCVPCERGKYSNENGAFGETPCKKCSSGRYNSARGVTALTDCEECPTGKTSTAGAITVDDCFAGCPVGSTTVSGTCKTCASGKWSSTVDSDAACTNCPSGKYIEDDGVDPESHDAEADCKFCPLGFQFTTASSCSICPAGYYNDPKNRVRTQEHDVLPWLTSDYLFSKIIEIAYGLEYDWDFIETQNKIAEA